MPRADPPAFEARELSFSYGDRRVLDGVSFEVARGEVFGLLGPNGSGKSTALAIACGLRVAGSGAMRFDGREVAAVSRHERAVLAVVFQRPALDDGLSVRENLSLAARLRGISGSLARERVARGLADAALESRADDLVKKLSGGMKRRLDIARALLDEPRLLLLDEPTSGLDEASFRRTWEQLDAERARRELTIIVATHRPDEAERCDRLAVLEAGRVAAIDTPEQLRAKLSKDVIVLELEPSEDARDSEAQRREVSEAIELPCISGERNTLLVEHERGHELIPRLVERLPEGRVRSISLRRPTLADAFLKITGHALEDDGAGDAGEKAA
ncbi:MAG: ABC transporter ATP-binding protein [Myxococcales bacterium]|nr:ABC transporter ATP-binding protein [Myxococcales bacterium]